MCKINADRAVAKTVNRGSVRVVCRALDGQFLGASTIVFEGVTDPGCLEALACRESLALAADLGIGDVMVASDCLEVVQGLKGQNLGRFSSILLEIENTARQHGGVSFRHEGRRSNEEAHRMARYATSLSLGRHVWLATLPEGLSFPVNILVNN
jgi:hypothetical protein